jgi:carboxypeptidase PM20D1
VIYALEASPATNAMIRTTTAVTIVEGGTKDNVLPGQARALVNFRILPGDTVNSVLEHVRRVVDDARVEARIAGRFSAEPSPVSSTATPSYQRLERAIQRLVPGIIVAPYLVVVATDSRHFQDLSDNIYRFLPVRLSSEEVARIHAVNERIEVDRYEDAVRIYRQIMLESAGG